MSQEPGVTRGVFDSVYAFPIRNALRTWILRSLQKTNPDTLIKDQGQYAWIDLVENHAKPQARALLPLPAPTAASRLQVSLIPPFLPPPT